jgi:hypothetical protein
LWTEFKAQTSVLATTLLLELMEDLKDDYDIFARNLQDYPRPQSKDDFEEYLLEPTIPIDKPALSWW